MFDGNVIETAAPTRLSNPVQVNREPVAARGGAGAAAVPQYLALPGVRGNGIASRTLERPVT